METTTRITNRNETLRKSLLRRLRTVEGQIRGIEGMVENDAYCDEILIQITAARAALLSISKLLLENHLHSCIAPRMQEGDEEALSELLLTIERML